MLGNAIAGVAHVLVGTQPLLILRPTGPITMVSYQVYLVSQTYGVDFWSLYAWTGLFVGLYCTVIAATGVCSYIRHVTRFT